MRVGGASRVRQAVKVLQRWLAGKQEFDELDLMKLWLGLYYCPCAPGLGGTCGADRALWQACGCRTSRPCSASWRGG